MAIERGQIYFVDLGYAIDAATVGHPSDPTGLQGPVVVGNEICKRRPVLVLSINDINNKPLVVTIVPGTSTLPRRNFDNVAVVQPTRDDGLSCETSFLCHQIRALDHCRFHAPAGRLSGSDLHRIEEAVRYSLGLGVRRPQTA
jgi:mRNA interferase MazF